MKTLYSLCPLFTVLLFATLPLEGVEATTPAPQLFAKLLQVEPGEGQVIRLPGFDLAQPGAKFQDWPKARLVYEQTYTDYGSYRLEFDEPEAGKATGRMEIRSESAFPIKPNRNYLLSVLVKTDFDRQTCEFNVYMRLINKQGRGMSPRHTLGLPAVTNGPDGWQRLEWTITTPTDPRIAKAKAGLDFTSRKGDRPAQMRIADYTFIELPQRPLQPLARGEGVTFPGGAGDLPMKVESCTTDGDQIIVQTTGAKYVFDTKAHTILASQRIDFVRELAHWQSSLPFTGLRVDKHSETECVLSNDELTIGVQCDSLIVISPQKELQMTVTNLLGGDYNRYSRGYLYSTDDFGGISVDPYLPPGTGLEPHSELLTEDLSFERLTPFHATEEELATKTPSKDPWNSDEAGSAKPGWKARWTTLPGALFTTSIFPPRPFDWEKSFTSRRATFQLGRDPFTDAPREPKMSHWLLWDHIPKMFGHSYSDEYEPANEEEFRNLVAKAHEQSIGILCYMSAYWTPTRDENVYIAGVRKFKEKYGIDGVYSDGLPSVDWILAYKEMRMLRALFPSGTISIHNSIQQAGWDISQQKPFLYTYADQISMTEGVVTHSGIEWKYPRYFTSQFRKSNALGKTYGGKWHTPDGKLMKEANDLVTLVYNGRNDFTSRQKYNAILPQLQQLWKEKGDQPFFYDRYYLPTAQKLTGYKVGRTGMPIVEKHLPEGQNVITLKSLSPDAIIYYTTDGTIPGKNSPRYNGPFTVAPSSTVKAIAVAPELEPSAIAIITPEGR